MCVSGDASPDPADAGWRDLRRELHDAVGDHPITARSRSIAFA